MKKLFVIGLILALCLMSLPVVAEDGAATGNGDVPPTIIETPAPTEVPTADPTAAPTAEPTVMPTPDPTAVATPDPTPDPTAEPTAEPTVMPTPDPTAVVTPDPTTVPTTEPTAVPTAEQTVAPTTVQTTVPVPTATVTYAANTVPIMVKFKGSANKAKIDEAITASGGKSERDLSQIRTRVIRVPAGEVNAVLAKYKNNGQVERASGPVKFRIAAIPSDTNYALQWALPAMDWDTAYTTIPVTGSATLAVLDTGIDATHPDLAGRIGAGQSFTASIPTVDTNGHGTALAGIAAADVNNGIGIAGVAYSPVTILPVQVLQADGTGWDADVVAGVLWAADNNADVILMGFSSTEYSAALADAITYAQGKGVVIVAASGNDGTSTPTYPAGMSGVIGVAATDNTNTIATFSNTGSASVAAPGVAILATKPGSAYTVSSGTSAASAEVAGLATLLAANGKSAAEIATQIKGTTDPVLGSAIGQVNVLNALSGVAVVTPVPMPTPTVTPVPNVTYVAGAMSISSISPNSGPISGGTSVTISGSGFGEGGIPYTVTFGSVTVTATRDNGNTLTAVTPPHAAGAVDVTVRDTGSKNPSSVTLTNGFTYNAATNQAPVLGAIGNKNVDEQVLLSFTATATDDGLPTNTLTYSLVGTVPTGASITTGGAFSWTPAENQGPGSYTFDVVVSDGALTDSETITVTVNEVNRAPTIADVPASATIDEMTATPYTFTATASDPDLPANTLTFSLVGAPTGASIGGTSGIFTWTPAEDQGPGDYTITVKVTDSGTPAMSDQKDISIHVNEVNRAPTLANVPSIKGLPWGETLSFTATATDPDLPANTLTFSLIGAPTGASIGGSSGVFSWTPTSDQIGPHFFKVRVTDNGVNPNNLYDEKSITVTVGKRETLLTYNGDLTEQYSDSASLSATLTDKLSGAPIAGKQVTYTIGSQSTSATTAVSTGIASTSLILTQDPLPIYTVKSDFAGDSLYITSSDTYAFDITQEDARVTYTGLPTFATPSPTSTTATVTSSATIQDITAVSSSDPAYDGNAGDIRNAKVTFTKDGTPINGCIDLPVGLVNSADTKVGTATCTWSATASTSTGGTIYTIGTIVKNYYTRNSVADVVPVNVYIPSTTNFITGGGHLVLSSSNGQYAGNKDSKNNFGFNVKYNKAKTNLQGNLNAIFRRTEADGILHVYQIKSTSWGTATLTVTPSTGNGCSATTATATCPISASFTAKADLYDITNPLLSPQTKAQGAPLQVTMTDYGEPGSKDTIGITLSGTSGSGGVLFSSTWNGVKTIEKVLGGGNLVVH